MKVERGLRLFSQAVSDLPLKDVPNLLLQKFPARVFLVETALKFSPAQVGEQAGLTVMGRNWASLGLRSTNAGFAVIFNASEQDTITQPVKSNTLHLRVDVQDGGLCRFLYAERERNLSQ